MGVENADEHIPKTVPDDLKGWNWGAFFFNWIWAFGNQVWIGMLGLLPCIGILMSIYLGVCGNELAWKTGRWQSVEQFKAVQKKWAIAGVVWVLITVPGLYNSFAHVQTTDPYHLPKVNEDPIFYSKQPPLRLYPGSTGTGKPGVYTTSDNFYKVADFYESEATKSGWRVWSIAGTTDRIKYIVREGKLVDITLYSKDLKSPTTITIK